MRTQCTIVVALGVLVATEARLFRQRKDLVPVEDQEAVKDPLDDPLFLANEDLPEDEFGLNFFKNEENLIRYLGVGSLPSISDEDSDFDSSDDVDSSPTEGTCYTNPKCNDLGLIGACCPTPKGIYMECCEAGPSSDSVDVELVDTCSMHPKCHDLGLHGECCPSKSGVFLGCCSDGSPDLSSSSSLKGSMRPTPAPRPADPAPTRNPTPGPTRAPVSRMPTPAPTNEQCQVDVSIECVTTEGTSCDALQAPQPQCAIGAVEDQVSFSYNGRSCQSSNNSQNGFESFPDCEDLASPISGPVLVECKNLVSGTVLLSSTKVHPGETFTVRSNNGRSLPHRLQCTLSDQQNPGDKIQRLTMNLSGSESLVLKDTFGSLTLEGCDQQNCIHDIFYTYKTRNVGSADMTVTKAKRVFNGDSSDITDLISPNPLSPGSMATLREQKVVDICTPTVFLVEFDVDASPPIGEGCQDDDTLSFGVDAAPTFAPTRSPTPAPTHSPSADPTSAPNPDPTPPPTMMPTNDQCNVQTSIECLTTEGTSCDTLMAPQPMCSTGQNLRMVRFTYEEQRCSSSDNVQTASNGRPACQDVSNGSGGPVNIACINPENGSGLDVSPSVVHPNGSFKVRPTSGGVLPNYIQCTLRDRDNGNKQLQILQIDVSGSQDLILKNTFGSLILQGCDEQNCLHDLHYTFNAGNGGDADLTIFAAERNFNGEARVILSMFGVTTVSPGQTVSVKEGITDVDICGGTSVEVSLMVEATPPNGQNCQDNPVTVLTINAAPTSSPTKSPTRGPTPNPSPMPTLPPTPGPTPNPSMVPTKNPTRSPSLAPRPDPTRPPTPLPTNDQCDVQASIECVTNTGRDCNSITVLQLEDCVQDLHYTFNTGNSGNADLTVTKAERNFNGGSRSLIYMFPFTTIAPGQVVTVKESLTGVNVCEPNAPRMTFSVEANPPTGQSCRDDPVLVFSIQPAPVSSPSQSSKGGKRGSSSGKGGKGSSGKGGSGGKRGSSSGKGGKGGSSSGKGGPGTGNGLSSSKGKGSGKGNSKGGMSSSGKGKGSGKGNSKGSMSGSSGKGKGSGKGSSKGMSGSSGKGKGSGKGSSKGMSGSSGKGKGSGKGSSKGMSGSSGKGKGSGKGSSKGMSGSSGKGKGSGKGSSKGMSGSSGKGKGSGKGSSKGMSRSSGKGKGSGKGSSKAMSGSSGKGSSKGSMSSSPGKGKGQLNLSSSSKGKGGSSSGKSKGSSSSKGKGKRRFT